MRMIAAVRNILHVIQALPPGYCTKEQITNWLELDLKPQLCIAGDIVAEIAKR